CFLEALQLRMRFLASFNRLHPKKLSIRESLEDIQLVSHSCLPKEVLGSLPRRRMTRTSVSTSALISKNTNPSFAASFAKQRKIHRRGFQVIFSRMAVLGRIPYQ